MFLPEHDRYKTFFLFGTKVHSDDDSNSGVKGQSHFVFIHFYKNTYSFGTKVQYSD